MMDSDDTGDITPQLSQEEAIAIMRGGLGAAELDLVGSFCTPIYWIVGRTADGRPIPQNGTSFFLDAGDGVFGVTAYHVIRGWRLARATGAGPLCIAGQGTPLQINWGDRVIAAHSGIDIATFRVSRDEVARLGKTVLTGSQSAWPPRPPTRDRGIYFCGFPQIETISISQQALSFGIVRASGVASSVNDRDVVCLFQREFWLPDRIHGAPPANFDFGGISGGLMLTVVQNRLRTWALAGVIYEGPSTSEREGDSITDFEIVRARRAHFILPNGQLDTALWHSLDGVAHVE